MSETEPEQETPLEEPEPQDEPGPDEAEEDAEEPAAEPEPTKAPQPEPPQDEERQAIFAKIDRSFGTYKAAVERNLGDEVTDWMFCPLCATAAVPAFFNKHDVGRVPEEVVANVQTVFGFAREGDYADAPGVVGCTDCLGKGKVKTGSLVAEHMTITCPTCKGYGYTPPPGTPGLHSVAVGNGQHEAENPHADLETPDRDNWGEPRVLPDGTLNDNYGKQPQFKTRHPVYGETRLLQPEELISG